MVEDSEENFNQPQLRLEEQNSSVTFLGTLQSIDEEDTSVLTSRSEGDGVIQPLKKIEADVAPRINSLIENETKAVFWWRMILFALLFSAALLVSIFVFMYVRNDELEQFEREYYANAERLVESFHDAVEQKLGAVNALATTLTSYAHSTNRTFPFVTLPNFVERGSDLRVLANALSIQWMPLITDDNRKDWEAYAFKHRYHVDDSYEIESKYLEQQDTLFGLSTIQNRALESENASSTSPNILSDGTGYHPKLWSLDGVEPEGSGPYLPLWQRSPVNIQKQEVVNWDFTSTREFSGLLPIVQADLQAVISVSTIPTPSSQEALEATLRISQYRTKVQKFMTDPMASMVFPVFDRYRQDEFHDTASDYGIIIGGDDTLQNKLDTRKLVGVLTTTLYWKQYFINILSPTAVGLICVLKNSYNQTFSYRIDGSEVTFLGTGDRHDPEYKHLKVSADVNSYIQERAKIQTRSYNAVEVNQKFGRYQLHVYPSFTTEDAYTTHLPKTYTILVASIFLIAMMVFLLFTILVERRQRILMKRTIQSGTIVSSLFPEKVEERLYDASRNDQKQVSWFHASPSNNSDANASCIEKEENKVAGYLAQGYDVINDGCCMMKSVRPIADSFPQTTIMFADIAGFTSWSSNHPPEEVFELLETLYRAFDIAAEKRKVFKVETIGDCYLAVTGLPLPQIDHAVIMAKFARDCLYKMKDLVQNQLFNSLGSDTSNLQLRVGLHSGSVTAGVLRGRKARFQLFGDAVNTAARIESTSVAGKIHVSQATADALILRGKSSWLSPRKEKVEAKGKGELVTYWVTVPSRNYDDMTDSNLDNSQLVKALREQHSGSSLTPHDS